MAIAKSRWAITRSFGSRPRIRVSHRQQVVGKPHAAHLAVHDHPGLDRLADGDLDLADRDPERTGNDVGRHVVADHRDRVQDGECRLTESAQAAVDRVAHRARQGDDRR